MGTGRLCGTAVLAALVCCHGTAAQRPSRVPATLVPKGWNVLQEITGDLNRDGATDVSFQLARDDEERRIEDERDDNDAMPRRLVVAFRERGGYRQVATDERVLSNIVQERSAGVGTDLTVERGSLVIRTHKDSGTPKWITTNRFRWKDGAFRQVGWTVESFDDGDDVRRNVFDANLLTGRIEESRPRLSVKKFRYPLIPVVLTRALPASLATPLSVRTLRLEETGGVPSNFSATLSLALVGEGARRKLYVRARVRDGGKPEAGEVRLLNADSVALRPEHVERVAVPGGYAWQARYDPASLRLRYGRLAAESPNDIRVPGWGIPAPDIKTLHEFFPGSLEVAGRSPSGAERTLSTAPRGKRPGLLWITEPELPRLGVKDNRRFDYLPPDFRRGRRMKR